MRAASVNRHQERSGRNAPGSDRVLAWWTSARVIGYSEASDCFRVVGKQDVMSASFGFSCDVDGHFVD
jgi:hypothetical protein